MENMQTLTLVVSIAIFAIGALVYIALRLLRLAERQVGYDKDRYRLSLEEEIGKLSKQLTYSADRFEQVNHLLMETQRATSQRLLPTDGPRQFLSEMGVDLSQPPDEKLVFVLMPFNPDHRHTYDVVDSTVEELGFRCSRGDDVHVSSNILSHILSELYRARLVIADISGRNPNVFYELGIAQALGKPVLLISEAQQDFPFDVSSMRVLMYRHPVELKEKLKTWLVQTLVGSQKRKHA